ncbi:hypothetical protein D4764_11G0003220 [Takifugu flavidus]|uniref:Uncharacterized protein n=1 Tax=Takifugu flavidus TaxID=433684 RepID=A0A5C6PH67_9TELE|nr:hypothetical protein D4764_11G0003220 [Takifugu flavidus]
MVVANQPNIVVVDKHQKTVVVTDVARASDSNFGNKEHKKLEKYQGLKEEIERMYRRLSEVHDDLADPLYSVFLCVSVLCASPLLSSPLLSLYPAGHQQEGPPP